MSWYLSKMAIDGFAVRLDMPEPRELAATVKRISSDGNQIARRLCA